MIYYEIEIIDTLSWLKKISEHELQDLICSTDFQYIDLKILLEDKGYSYILDGIDINGSSWGFREQLNFSDLSLRNCKFLDINAKSISFVNSDLSDAVIDRSVNVVSIDFSYAIMTGAYISKPIENISIFKDTEIDETIMVCGAGLIRALTKEQYDSTIHIKVEEGKYFSQDLVIERYNHLNKFGVCNGLVLDFARHSVFQGNANYITKLNNFLEGNDKGFADSILEYQTKLQTFELRSADEIDIDIEDINFIDTLPEKFKKASVVGITIKGSLGAHIIAVSKKDNGYVIFDPNIGEVECFARFKKDAISELNKQIFNIHRLYRKEMMAFDNVRVSNLEAVAVEIGACGFNIKHVKKYDMSGLYMFISLVFIIAFFFIYDFTDDYLNALLAVPVSIILSTGVSVYLGAAARRFYGEYGLQSTK